MRPPLKTVIVILLLASLILVAFSAANETFSNGTSKGGLSITSATSKGGLTGGPNLGTMVAPENSHGVLASDSGSSSSSSSATIDSWTNTTSYPFGVEAPSCVYVALGGVSNIYCIGGWDGSNYRSAVYSATLNASGGLDSWGATTSYPTTIAGESCAVWESSATEGDIYCVGGTVTGAGNVNNTYYTEVTASGIGSWESTTPYPVDIDFQSCGIYSDYIYCIAGDSLGSIIDSVYYAQVSSSGIGTWTLATNNYPSPDFGLSCAVNSGYIYCVGGTPATTSIYNTVYYASLSSTGVGSWTESSSNYPVGINFESCVVVSGYMYCVAGSTDWDEATDTSAVYYAPLSSPGIGAWQSAENYTYDVYGHSCVSDSLTLYCMGGWSDSLDGVVSYVYYYQTSAATTTVSQNVEAAYPSGAPSSSPLLYYSSEGAYTSTALSTSYESIIVDQDSIMYPQASVGGTSSLQYSSYPITYGAIGIWPLCEGAGSSAYELVNQNTATFTGSPTWQGNGKCGLSFSGDEYITASDSGFPTGTQARSIAVQFNMSSYPSSNAGIVGYGDSGNDGDPENSFYLVVCVSSGCGNGVQYQLCIGQWGGNDNPCTSTALTLNTIYSVVEAYNGTVASLYVNGVLAGSSSRTYDTTLTGSFGIGSSPFSGTINSVAVYDRALSAQEVSEWSSLTLPNPEVQATTSGQETTFTYYQQNLVTISEGSTYTSFGETLTAPSTGSYWVDASTVFVDLDVVGTVYTGGLVTAQYAIGCVAEPCSGNTPGVNNVVDTFPASFAPYFSGGGTNPETISFGNATGMCTACTVIYTVSYFVQDQPSSATFYISETPYTGSTVYLVQPGTPVPPPSTPSSPPTPVATLQTLPGGAIGVTNAPGASQPSITQGQSTTLTESIQGIPSPYTCKWLAEPPGASMFFQWPGARSCSSETFKTSALTPIGTWHFEVNVTETARHTSVVSPIVTVTVNPYLSIALKSVSGYTAPGGTIPVVGDLTTFSSALVYLISFAPRGIGVYFSSDPVTASPSGVLDTIYIHVSNYVQPGTYKVLIFGITKNGYFATDQFTLTVV